MKLRILASVLAIATVFSLSACESESSDKNVSDALDNAISTLDSEYSVSSPETDSKIDEPTETPTEAEKNSEFEFVIKSTSFSKDYEDKDVLIVGYDFTNNSDKATSFTFACQDTAFQDGVECDSTVIGCDELDAQEQLNDIQPGKTYTVRVGYHISDRSKPVDIVITDLFGQNTLLEETIDLNNL